MTDGARQIGHEQVRRDHAARDVRLRQLGRIDVTQRTAGDDQDLVRVDKAIEDGSLEKPAFITVLHNGVLIHNHTELKGITPFDRPPTYIKHAPKGPISLQDHGNPVRFRNIWVREFELVEGVQEREPFMRNGNKETPLSELSKQ